MRTEQDTDAALATLIQATERNMGQPLAPHDRIMADWAMSVLLWSKGIDGIGGFDEWLADIRGLLAFPGQRRRSAR